MLAVEVARPGDLQEVFRAASRAFPDLSLCRRRPAALAALRRRSRGFHPARCRVVLDEADFVQDITPLDDPWDLDPRDPPLRVLTLEPDCDPAHAIPRALRVQYGGQEHSFSLAPARPLLVNLRALLGRL